MGLRRQILVKVGSIKVLQAELRCYAICSRTAIYDQTSAVHIRKYLMPRHMLSALSQGACSKGW